MRVAMGHQLVGLLARGIERDRMVDVVVDRKRHLRVAAVDGTRRRVDEMLDLGMPAAFEDVQEAFDVAVRIGVGIDERIPHAGLRGEMHDTADRIFREQLFDPLAVRQIQLDELIAVQRREPSQASLLETYVVVIVDAVETDDPVSAREQPSGHVETDESGHPGDQRQWCACRHGSSSSGHTGAGYARPPAFTNGGSPYAERYSANGARTSAADRTSIPPSPLSRYNSSARA